MLHQARLARSGRCALVVLACAIAPAGAHAASPVALGSADSFALLAGSTITNTGPTTITGDIGLCCTGTAVTGWGSVSQPAGALYIGTGTPAETAQDDLDVAYFDAASRAVTATLPVDLSLSGTPANPLRPGVYESTSRGALTINTGLTLDFQGDPNAVFVFQGTTLITAAGAGGSVSIVNGGATASACNVFWQLSDATQGVTLGSTSAFKGTTMSLGASVLGTGATVEGRVLTRRSKAVNLDSNTISRTACAAPTSTGGGGTPATTAPPGDSSTTTQPVATPARTASPSAPPLALQPVVSTPPRRASASLQGPSGAVASPFRVWVTGSRIEKVVFFIDGRRVGTSHARRGRTRFVLNVDPRGQSRRVHRVTARVVFRRGSTSRTTTRRTTYRLVAKPRAPRFTG